MDKNPPSQAGKEKGVSGDPHAKGQLSLPTAVRAACPRNKEAAWPKKKHKSRPYWEGLGAGGEGDDPG